MRLVLRRSQVSQDRDARELRLGRSVQAAVASGALRVLHQARQGEAGAEEES